MRVLITGVTGFAGSHLAEYCLDRGVEVWGTHRCRSPRENIEHITGLNLIEADVLDPGAVRAAIEHVCPDWIFHLAAQSFVPCSWTAPEHTITTNVVGQLHVLEAVKSRPRTRVLVAGSSEEYGMVHPSEIPITETTPLRPLSPYGVSKVGQDLLGYEYHKSYGIHIVRTRAFNHSGPRRGELRAFGVRQADRRDRGWPAGAGGGGWEPRRGAGLHRRAGRCPRLLADIGAR